MDLRFSTGRRELTWMVVFAAAMTACWLTAAGQTSQLRLVSTIWPPFTNEGAAQCPQELGRS